MMLLFENKEQGDFIVANTKELNTTRCFPYHHIVEDEK
jgi:hypothetical protein